MADVDGNKKVSLSSFTGKDEFFELVYDFAEDGGALVATTTLILANATQPVIITEAVVYVETLCVGATAVVNIGSTDDGNGIVDNTTGAIAALTAGTTSRLAAGQALLLDTGDEIKMIISTAALTAGKIRVLGRVRKV